MLRTQISPTVEGRRALNAEAARTGRSISALIRDAVDAAYGDRRSTEADLVALRGALGSWDDRGRDGAELAIAATTTRTGARLLTLNIRHYPMFSDLRPPY